jgi:TetR/AcrR family acrAB operon transcriptional repressor
MDTALTAFVPHGISTNSLAAVVMTGKLNQRAMDGRLAQKTAMVREVFNSLIWPLDIGPDIYMYRQSGNPMQLLRDVLWLQMKNCLDDRLQCKLIRLLLMTRAADDLPADLRDRLEYISTRAIQRLTEVLNICYLRRGLRRGLTPIDVALGIHAAGLGVLAENTCTTSSSPEQSFFRPVDLILRGACKASCRNGSLLIDAGRGAA